MYAIYVLEHQVTRRTYVGISTDPQRRLRQHNGEISGGARTTKRHGPGWRIVDNTECVYDKGTALRIERKVKKSRGKKKRCEQLLIHHQNGIHDDALKEDGQVDLGNEV